MCLFVCEWSVPRRCSCTERARDGAARLTAAGEREEKLRRAPTNTLNVHQSYKPGQDEDSSLESVSFTFHYLERSVTLHVCGETLLLRRMRSRCSFWVDEEHPVLLLPWQPMMMRIFTAKWQGSQRMRFFEISNIRLIWTPFKIHLSLCVVSINGPSRKSMFNWNLARSPAGVPVILRHYPQYLLIMAHFRNLNIWFGYSFIFIWGLDRPVVMAWRLNIAVYSH